MNASTQALVTLAKAARRLKEIEEAKRCEDSFYEFVKAAWPHFDPSDFVGNWHLEDVCEHLEAVARGYINRLLINVPPRPVAADALVLSKRGLIRLDHVAVGDLVWTHQARWRRVMAVHDQGDLNVLKMTTRSGRTIEAEGSHPFLTPEGWFSLSDLKSDDVVGLPPCRDVCGQRNAISEEEARLLGYLVGDGDCQHTPKVTAGDDGVAADVMYCAETIGFSPIERRYKMTVSGYWLRSIAIRNTKKLITVKGSKNPVRQWITNHGLWKKTSYTKCIPQAVLEGSNEIVRAFIGAYWSCDGEISSKGAKKNGVEREDLEISCCSVNREFLHQMQILLWRLGIASTLYTKIRNLKTKRQGDTYTSHYLRLRTQDDCWRFSKLIEVTHRRSVRMKDAHKRRFDFDRSMWGESVESVVAGGTKRCLCLTVDEDASFTANGFAVHNTGKTNIASICFVPWVWAQREKGPLMGPQASFFYASYAEQLALEHSLKARRLIESPWYQKLWGSRFKLVSDRNKVSHFENNKGGYRLASSVDARSTGWGASAIFADDPHLVKEAESDLVREGVVRWWSESMPSRLNDRRTGAMVIIMQRVHEGDVAGDVLAKGGYVHLCVPMCYVPCQHVNAWVDGKVQTFIGEDIEEIDEDDIFWQDPRSEEDELLWPERYPASEVSHLEKELGPYAFCTPTESPVLMADLSLKPIGQIAVGDMVVGFEIGNDEKRAKLKPSKVLAISKSVRPVVKITLDSGETARCTEDHKWFTGRNDASHKLYKAANIGSPLRRVCPSSLPKLTSEEDIRLAGWVSGFFDGEGSVSLIHRRSNEGASLISFAQTAERNLPLCHKLEGALSHLGFNYNVHERKPAPLSAAGTPLQKSRIYYLKSDAGKGFTKAGPSRRASRLTLNQRFLHVVQPTKWRDRIIDTVTNGRMYTTTERVISIEPDGVETVYGLTTETGNYVVWGLASSNSSQFQQTPAPRGGGIIRTEWWQPWDKETAEKNGCVPEKYPGFEYILAVLDTAMTEQEENDPCALSIWGIWRDPNGNPNIFLMFCWDQRYQIHDLVQRVGDDCKTFKVDRLLIEDKAIGHSVSQELARLFGSFDFGIELVNPRTGFIKSADKVARLQSVVHLFSEGLVFAPDKEWADRMIKQCATVPRSIHDDLADTCSMGLLYLRRSNLIVRRDERALELEDETKYRPKMGSLYPV